MRKLLAVTLLVTTLPAFGWGHKGHELINKIAVEKLPNDVPAFLHSKKVIDQVTFQGPEPDRWYSKTEPELNAAQSLDHFMDMEWAMEAVGKTLPRKRFDYYRALAAAQAANPTRAFTPEKVGTLPYQATEVWERLTIAMRNYRELVRIKQDTAPVEALITYYIGWLGHYVADGSQPLHATYRYNGWVGENPNGYSTSNKFHSKFESEFVNNNIQENEIAALVPAKPLPHGDIFDDFVAYLTHTNSLVEKTYAIEKAGGIDGAGTPEGKAFVLERMSAGATELRDLIYFAWTSSANGTPTKFAE